MERSERISYTDAVMADLAIRQGMKRGEVAGRLLPDVSPERARAVLLEALRQHGLYQHNPAPNAPEANSP